MVDSSWTINDLFLKVTNPFYTPVPELLITALAWEKFTVDGVSSDSRLKYRRKQRQSSSSDLGNQQIFMFDFLTMSETRFDDFLKEAGFSIPQLSAVNQHLGSLPRAILSGVTGTASNKGDFLSASPMSPSIALLQNPRGMRGAQASYAKMLEEIWQLASFSEVSLADSWHQANAKLLKLHPALMKVDAAIDALRPRKERDVIPVPHPWIAAQKIPNLLDETPYGWFSRAWKNLTNEAWINRLPPRVWTDWATALLRTAFGFSYLWQANWYHLVAESILRGDPEPPFSETAKMELFPWQSRTLPTSLRQVWKSISEGLYTGYAIKDLLSKYLEQNQESTSWEDLVISFQSNQPLRDALVSAKNRPQKTRGSGDIIEAVSYSLKTRKEFGEGADRFGLLSVRGRFHVPNPGTEWLAVIVSLISPVPDSTINLGQLTRELNSLGLYPPTTEIIQDLERAGLAKGSADADFGLEIQTAY
jgi:hypothetical protein